MTISEIAKLLYTFCGNMQNAEMFLRTLVENIIEADAENPLKDYKDIRKIYSGARPLPRKIASYILGKIDTTRFIEYLNNLSDDATVYICEKLKTKGIYVLPVHVAEKCAELFFSAIKKIANVNKTEQAPEQECPYWGTCLLKR
ncbi:MAG: hypothetical protein FWE36_04785 [Erysipelotrichales bacterium]|nr:hypothetical protein [Erysipelotrichales bacterium]